MKHLYFFILFLPVLSYSHPHKSNFEFFNAFFQQQKAQIKLTSEGNLLIASFHADEWQSKEIYEDILRFLKTIDGFKEMTFKRKEVVVKMKNNISEDDKSRILLSAARVFSLFGFDIIN